VRSNSSAGSWGRLDSLTWRGEMRVAVMVIVEEADRCRVNRLADFVRAHGAEDVLKMVASQLNRADAATVAAMCRFARAGILVFPTHPAGWGGRRSGRSRPATRAARAKRDRPAADD
jgi:hypothetical protein